MPEPSAHSLTFVHIRHISTDSWTFSTSLSQSSPLPAMMNEPSERSIRFVPSTHSLAKATLIETSIFVDFQARSVEIDLANDAGVVNAEPMQQLICATETYFFRVCMLPLSSKTHLKLTPAQKLKKMLTCVNHYF